MIEQVIRNYIKVTSNIDIVIQHLHQVGVDHQDINVRFRFIKSVPTFVVENLKVHNSTVVNQGQQIKLSQVANFTKLVEKLLLRAKGDRAESIRIEA